MLPYIEIGVVALFILLGYIGFQQIRSSEKSSIWAGMAKETAHQLGTPLSSLMGWTAVLESKYEGDENILEMKRDIDRLEKVTNRFSKIGSEPVLIKTKISAVIMEAVNYYQKRLPQLGRKITLEYATPQKNYAMINSDLFSWAVENLIKNSIDAIGNKDGIVTIKTETDKDNINIDVQDTGKGIEKRNWDNIFKPGYSTKRRGWGLGLSLTKRIIEMYHKGKIYVKTSKPGVGTNIRISIPKIKNS
jgi:signal transduction histidine kinase